MMQIRTLAAAGVAIATLGITTVAQAVPEVFNQAETIEIGGAEGMGQASGEVSTDYEVFSFEATEGEVVTLDVNVTETLEGTEYTDDDSQLFLFNSDGILLTENDDENESTFESKISDFVIPSDGTYFVVVTTWDNDPTLNEENVVVDWGSEGGSNIRYDLVVTKKDSLPESAEQISPEAVTEPENQPIPTEPMEDSER
jgi:hypothetical protein